MRFPLAWRRLVAPSHSPAFPLLLPPLLWSLTITTAMMLAPTLACAAKPTPTVSPTLTPTATATPTPIPFSSLLANATFETPPFAIAGSVDGWVVSGNGAVSSAQEGSTTPTHSAAFGVQGAILSQVVNLAIGQTYNLDFDAGIFGKKTGSVNLQAQVLGGSILLDQTVTPPSANTTDPNSV